VRSAAALLLLIAALTSCASRPIMVPATSAAVRCVYGILKSTPGVTEVEVYASRKEPIAIVTYRMPMKENPYGLTEVTVWGAHVGYCGGDCDFHAQYRGEFGVRADDMKAKCDAEWGYLDEVIFTDHMDRIAMPE
jgi:hypothetical protein